MDNHEVLVTVENGSVAITPESCCYQGNQRVTCWDEDLETCKVVHHVGLDAIGTCVADLPELGRYKICWGAASCSSDKDDYHFYWMTHPDPVFGGFFEINRENDDSSI